MCTALRFEVSLKEGTCMLWKPASLQMKNMKAKNCASFFDAKQIFESPAVEQAHLVQKSQNSPATYH